VRVCEEAIWRAFERTSPGELAEARAAAKA